jgi:2-oxoglutarate dehydrogenase E1 component
LYYEEMYRKYLEDPNSVGQAWREYFENKDSGAASQSLGGTNIDALADKIAQRIGGASTGSGSSQSASEVARVLNLYRSYQTVGHEKANTDPLKLMEAYGNVMQIGKRKKLNK